MRTLYLSILLSAVAAIPMAQAQNVYYVTPDGAGDGSSWESATTLAQAITSASGSADAADIILVKKGTYTAPADDGLGFYFQTKPNIAIYGNCEGTESATDLPVIDGDTPLETYLVAPVDDSNLPLSRVITIYKGSVSFTGFDISGGTASFSTTRGLNEGGAVWIYGQGVLQNCNIHGASSLKGGGVFLSNFEADKVAMLNSCRIYDCKTVGDGKDALGGGVYMKNGTSVHNCKVENNEASYAGGGIYCEASGFITNTVVTNNVAVRYSSGAIHNRGGIIANCLITGNEAALESGAITLGSEEAQVINSTIVNNQLNNTSGSAISGGIMVENGHVKNCIVWGNRVNQGSTERDIRISGLRTGTLTNTCYKVASVVPADAQIVNCIQDDPLFVNAESGDYHLAEGSPCINAGSNDLYALVSATVDLDGNDRIHDTTIDMGAYEYGDDISTGIGEFSNAPKIYAAAGRLVIEGAEGEMAVFDILGRICHQQVVSGRVELPLSSGIYIVRLNGISQKISVRQ